MRFSALAVIAGLAVGMAGCGSFYPYGVIYNGTTTPHAMERANIDGTNKGGSKHGESCTTGILWLVAWGDASTSAAKNAGGIKEVHSVEFKNTSFLAGVYAEGCTIVTGE
jgi:hypothetical protein